MNNKSILQIISGVLMFLSFLSSWVYDGLFSTKPDELIANSDYLFFKILFYLLPVLGIVNVYRGFLKKHSIVLNIICILDCLILMGCILQSIMYSKGVMVSTGFYLAGLAVLVSAASIFILKKEIKEKNISSNG